MYYITRALTSDDDFKAEEAFQIISLFLIIRGPFVILPIGIALGGQVAAAFTRLDAFLAREQRTVREDRTVCIREEGTDRWFGSEEFVLTLPAFTLAEGSFYAVVGRVGSGKTAFLHTLLGEMQASVPCKERIGYCAQSPFIRHRSVRSNITGEESFVDLKRYEEVVTKCALKTDIDLFPERDETEIGERGINLSGGQKARIALARALYSKVDILVLDDILSAMDPGVADCILNDVFLAETRTRVIVSTDLRVAQKADQVLFLADGIAYQPAPYEELRQKVPEFDAFVTDARLVDRSVKPTSSPTELKSSAKNASAIVEEEKIHRGAIPFAVYKSYFAFASSNNVLRFLLVVALFLLAECAYVSVDIWVAQWSEDTLGIGVTSITYVQIYAGIAGGYFFFILARSIIWVFFSFKASVILFQSMMGGVLRSPLRFFEMTPSGRILNRTSKDAGDADSVLPDRWLIFSITTLRVASILITISYTAPPFVAVFVPFLFIYVTMLNYYRHTSRELQRLESTSRSPLFSSYTEMVNGLSTFRAFQWEQPIMEQFEAELEQNTRALYVLRHTDLWFNQRLLFVGAGIILSAALIIAAWRENVSRGMAGVALTFVLNLLINLSMAMQNFSVVEAMMSGVERMREYAILPPEEDYKTTKYSPDKTGVDSCLFPTGAISFLSLTCTYRVGLDPALKDFTVDIAGGSFVGLSGRTGAGKSTLFLAILRLISYEGCVRIDGIDIKTISLRDLRKAITSVPQDPVLFSGTLRQNVDVFRRHTDEDIWQALTEAHFVKFVEDKGDQGLDCLVTSGGTNWSVGEKQLICFGRAMLQRTRILLLDEATSSMDSATDALLQATLRQESLQKTTRLVIAHRLETIADADQILVIDQGQLESNTKRKDDYGA